MSHVACCVFLSNFLLVADEKDSLELLHQPLILSDVEPAEELLQFKVRQGH